MKKEALQELAAIVELLPEGFSVDEPHIRLQKKILMWR